MATVIGASTGWWVGLVLGIVVIAVAAAIVITIVMLARRIAAQASGAVEGVEVVRAQTDELAGLRPHDLHALDRAARLRRDPAREQHDGDDDCGRDRDYDDAEYEPYPPARGGTDHTGHLQPPGR